VIFSETVNLHPVAIIGAVLVFGGLWGLPGVFFCHSTCNADQGNHQRMA